MYGKTIGKRTCTSRGSGEEGDSSIGLFGHQTSHDPPAVEVWSYPGATHSHRDPIETSKSSELTVSLLFRLLSIHFTPFPRILRPIPQTSLLK